MTESIILPFVEKHNEQTTYKQCVLSLADYLECGHHDRVSIRIGGERMLLAPWQVREVTHHLLRLADAAEVKASQEA